MKVGDTVQLDATARDAGGVPIPDTLIVWTARTPATTQVDANGKATALDAGVFNIEAKIENGVHNILFLQVLS